jgi:2-hydroxychromene-2-carboxylate isomerase
MMTQIRIYHSFRSPYSRLGLHKIDRAGLAVNLIPFTGPPEGVPFSDPVQSAPKLAYYMLDAPRMTMLMGLLIASPNPFEVDLTAANKAAIAAECEGKGLGFALAVSDARWGEGENISKMSVIEACAEKSGWSASAVRNAQDDPDITALVKKHREMIEQDGVFGVPFAVMGAAKYWGHDRFDLLVEEAAR